MVNAWFYGINHHHLKERRKKIEHLLNTNNKKNVAEFLGNQADNRQLNISNKREREREKKTSDH